MDRMWAALGRVAFAAVCLVGVVRSEQAAEAQQVDLGNFLNLSVTGDGKTPSALELAGMLSPKVSAAATPVGAGASGDASWSLPLSLPPARHMPQVSFGYASGGRAGLAGRGFSVDAGLTLHRPLGGEARAYADVPGVVVASGALDGLLVPDGGGGYAWVSERPGAVVATYDAGEGRWTVSAGTTTWTLEARADVDWASLAAAGLGLEGAPWQWRTVSSEDTLGNRVDYTWSGPKLASMAYGATEPSEHFLRVVFGYRAAATVFRQPDHGHVDRLTERLSSITVQTSYGHESFEERLRYTLTYDAADEFLERIDESWTAEDGAVSPQRLVAAFEYTEGPAEVVETTDLPADLSATWTNTRSDGTTTSSTKSGLFDVSGDGLVDLVGATLDAVGRQLVDAGVRWWEDRSVEPPAFSVDGIDLDQSVTVAIDVDWEGEVDYGSYGVRRLVDLDGDGALDLVRATEAPESYVLANGGVNGDAAEANRAPVGSVWQVQYGAAGSLAAVPSDEATPFRFLSVSHRPHLPESLAGQHDPFYLVQESEVELVDIDGDGWLDLAEWVLGDGLYWYRRIPEREAGWELEGRFALDTVDAPFESLRESKGIVTVDPPDYAYVAGYTQETPTFEYLEQRTGLTDLDGDGSVDFVSTRGWTEAVPEWEVWFGTGAGFEPQPTAWPAPVPWMSRSDEGAPWVTTGTLPGGLGHGQEDIPAEDAEGQLLREPEGGAVTSGRDQAVLGGPLDVDGDGRADLVVGEEEVWFRNTGDGFALVGQVLPAWYPRATVGSPETEHESVVLSLSQTKQDVLVSDAPASYPPRLDGEVNPAVGKNTTWVTVQDVTGDGLPDVFDRREPATAWISAVTVDGAGEQVGFRGGLLSAVTLGTGARTTLTWGASTELWPSGSTGPHQTPIRKDVLRSVTLTDPVTGAAVRTDSDYRDGLVVDGRWWGFETVTREEWSFAPDPGEVEPSSWRWLGESETEHLLSRDAVLPLEQRVWTDRATAFAVGAGEAEVPHLRTETISTYTDHHPGGPPALWLTQVQRVEWSEDHEALTAPATSRTTQVTLGYDAVGNLTLQRHTAPSRAADTLELVTEWVGEGALWVPAWSQTRSADPAAPATVRAVEEVHFAYDGQPEGAVPTAGLLTSQRACGGVVGDLCDAAEDQVWSFDHDARGAVVEIHAPGGRATYVDATAFGGVVPVDESNALGHRVVREIDDLGRVVIETDPNGVSTRTLRDGYGRTIEAARLGEGGSDWLVSSTTTYADGETPRWSKSKRYTYGVGGVPTGESSEYQVFDGVGEPVQTWKQHSDLAYYLVVDEERDLRGQPRRRSAPKVIPEFDPFYAGTRGGDVDAWWAHDLLGTAVRSFTATGGVVRVDAPAPGVSRAIDDADWEKDLAHDTHGRVIEVQQGYTTGPKTVTGQYAHDGRARVTSFTDGNGNRWTTSYDGVGRRRQVWRQGPEASATPYMGFLWDGPDPVAMVEGDAAIDPVTVLWEHDPLGRPVHKDVWDPILSTWMAYDWWWDEDPTGVNAPWSGVRHQVDDPKGSTRYRYEADPTVGGFGFVTGLDRTSAMGQELSFHSTYDADGREVEKVWPSGATVSTTHGPTGQIQHQVLSWAGRSASVVYAYDELDRLGSWSLASEGTSWSQHPEYQGSTSQVSRLLWQELPANEVHTIDYDRLGNGWVGARHVDQIWLQYEYDALGRVIQLSDTNGTLESYSYDAANNLLTMMRDGEGVWDYDPVPQFNEAPGRSRGGGVHESMTWDPVTGRMLSRTTTTPNPASDISRGYAYDGSGRLRLAQRAGGGGLEVSNLFYDVDDEVVHEDRFGATPATVLRFGGHRAEVSAAGTKVHEAVLPMVRLEDGELRVVYLEPDGHAVWTRGLVASIADTTELLGVYGQELLAYGSPADPVLDGYHGAEMDRTQELVHFGVRHVGLADGAWLQPEPLLHLGLTNGDLANPLGYLGRYSGGNPVMMTDPQGLSPTEAQLTLVQQIQLDLANAYGTTTMGGRPEAALAASVAGTIGRAAVEAVRSALSSGVVGGALAGASAWVQGDGAPTADVHVPAGAGAQGVQVSEAKGAQASGVQVDQAIRRIDPANPSTGTKRHAHGTVGANPNKGTEWSINEDGTVHDGKTTRIPKKDAKELEKKGFDIPPDRYPRPNK